MKGAADKARSWAPGGRALGALFVATLLVWLVPRELLPERPLVLAGSAPQQPDLPTLSRRRRRRRRRARAPRHSEEDEEATSGLPEATETAETVSAETAANAPGEVFALDNAAIGPGGSEVLFLPCYIDGFMSNMRQVVASVYLARRFNLSYVSQDLWYKFQDSGRIGGVDGPINMFDVLDREHMSKYLRTTSQKEFWEGRALDSPIKESINMVGIDQGVRCEIRTDQDTLGKGFRRWLNRYGLGKSGFISNRIKSRANQWKKLTEISWLDPPQKFVLSGTPRFKNVLKDYTKTSAYRTSADVPEFWLSSFEAIRFAKPLRDLQQAARARLGIGPEEPYIAVHLRRGNTYAIGGKAGQARTSDVEDAVQRAKACVGKPVTTIFVSTMLPFLRREIESLQAAFPDHKVVGIGTDLTWEDLRPGLGERNQTIIRAGVEMQFWFEADAFIGSRSTMSSFMQLMRLAAREPHDACNRFAQKKWADKALKQAIP